MESWQRRRLWRTLIALVVFIGALLYAWSLRPVHAPVHSRPASSPVALPVSTAAWTVTPLEDSSCHPALLADFAAARETIDVAMYVIRMDAAGPVKDLLDALEAARARGVQVRVLLDRSLQGQDRHDLLNRAAAARLQEARATVRFDRPEIELHDKLVIVDGRIAYVGAHNWTPDALSENHELSVRLESPEPLVEASATFLERWGEGSDPGKVVAERATGTGRVLESEE